MSADPSNQATDIQIKSEAELPPNTGLYTSQSLVPGNNYITARRNSAARLCLAPRPYEDGPIQPSSITPATVTQPGQQFLDYELFCDDLPVLCDVPSFGAGLFVGLMGYASMGVNKRGTGCSGGAYDYFEAFS